MAIYEQNIHPGIARVIAALVVGQGVDGRVVVVVLQTGTDVTVVGNVSGCTEVGLAGTSVDLTVRQVTVLVQEVEVRTVGGIVREETVELAGVHEECQPYLLKVTGTVNATGFLASLAERRK